MMIGKELHMKELTQRTRQTTVHCCSVEYFFFLALFNHEEELNTLFNLIMTYALSE